MCGLMSEATTEEAVTYPDARAPDRQRWVDAQGVRIRVHEWGDEGARPLMCVHGGFDFGQTFSAFAPLLADAGWRVVAWDHRGHGDSEHAALYSWEADVRDAMAVLDSTTREPVPVIAHSKGGSMFLTITEMYPHRIWRFVNVDGMPSPMAPSERPVGISPSPSSDDPPKAPRSMSTIRCSVAPTADTTRSAAASSWAWRCP